MGNFDETADALGYTLGGVFFDRPPTTLKTDPRTGYIRAEEARRIAMADALAAHYRDMLADPTAGLPDPVAQRYMEQELIDSVYNRLGAGGALGSGTARAAAAKALTDYRLGLLRERGQALERLRQQMIGVTSTGGTPYVVTPVEGQEALTKGLAKSFVGGMGGMMGGV